MYWVWSIECKVAYSLTPKKHSDPISKLETNWIHETQMTMIVKSLIGPNWMRTYRPKSFHFGFTCHLKRFWKCQLMHANHRWTILSLIILLVLIIPTILILIENQNKSDRFLSFVPLPNAAERFQIGKHRKCFEPLPNLDKIVLLPDVLEREIKPKPDNSTSFIATTCPSNGIVLLNLRWVCRFLHENYSFP